MAPRVIITDRREAWAARMLKHIATCEGWGFEESPRCVTLLVPLDPPYSVYDVRIDRHQLVAYADQAYKLFKLRNREEHDDDH